jgi:choline kinase
MLDSRAPAGLPDSYKEEEEKRLKAAEEKVKHLMAEARLWRIANSAQWVAWGIVQAQVDGLDDDEEPSASSSSTPSTRDDPKMHAISMSSDKLSSDVQEKHDQHLHDHRPEGLVAEALAHGGDKDKDLVKEAEKAEAEDDEDEFDYLGYAHQRAMFFWGDCVELGLVKLEELPEALRGAVRIVAF